MNDLSTVKPLYPGAFPQPDVHNSDAPYPKAPLNLTLGFDLETFQIPLENWMPSKKEPDDVMTTRKFKQIVSSVRKIWPDRAALGDQAESGDGGVSAARRQFADAGA